MVAVGESSANAFLWALEHLSRKGLIFPKSKK